MNRERLSHLLDLLQNLSPDLYNHQQWYEETDWGIAGCAGGHASRDPLFNKMGLVSDWLERPRLRGSFSKPPLDCLAEFFDLSEEQTHSIFHGGSAATLRQTIAKIEEILNVAE